MKTVAIIPARGGSKSIHRKNLQYVGGYTLVARAIRHAQAAKIDQVYVTSDDEEILEHARDFGASTIKRPADLATDTANGDLVAIHALGVIGITEITVPDDHVTVFLLPTAPLRPPGIIQECISELGHWDYDSVFTAYLGHFAWHVDQASFTSSHVGRYIMKPLPPWAKRVNRQKISRDARVFIENGAAYATRTSEYLKLRSDPTEWNERPLPNRLCGRIGVVEMLREDSIDIDTEYDLWLAEQRLLYLSSRKERDGQPNVFASQ